MTAFKLLGFKMKSAFRKDNVLDKFASFGLGGVLLGCTTLAIFFCPSIAAATVSGTKETAATDSASRALDVVTLGNADSESAHQLTGDHTEVVAHGGLGETARRLLPYAPARTDGGSIAFTMKVDPVRQNYFTAKFWGSEFGEQHGRLILFCQRKQVGYRHLGDVDILNIADSEPGYNGRFYYNTTPLPLSMTKGKTRISLEVRSIGRIWGYGNTWEQYQKVLDQPTVGMYRFYTNADPYFAPPAEEKQGVLPKDPPVRPRPGDGVLQEIKARVNREIDGLLKSKGPLNQSQMKLLARAYAVEWSHAYREPKVVAAIVAGVDNKVLHDDDGHDEPNSDWVGFGTMGEAVARLGEPLRPYLDQPIANAEGATVARRAAWSKLFQATRDSRRTHRRQYTNQSMITDLNIYLSNLAIQTIDPANAFPETRTLDYLYQAMGIEPWLGSDTAKGPEKPLGDHYYEVTQKGLSKELGYVGYYGEILDWGTTIYKSTQIGGRPGDEKIKAQLEKMARARSYFRYPTLDGDGYRAMRIETVVGWRDTHYPGDVTYGERPSWDGTMSYEAAATQDPQAIGYMQQALADNQYFNSLASALKERGLRTTLGLLDVPSEYKAILAQPRSMERLPMTWSQPNVAWADEEDGVLALKHGEEILYVSLYWRARYGINNLARVHDLKPGFDRMAVVHEDAQFEPSGNYAVREDWVDLGFGRGHVPPGDIHQSQAGERMPMAAAPKGQTVKPGAESPYAGRASFYTLRYGKYLIGMNTTPDRTFTVDAPAGVGEAWDLITGKTVKLTHPVEVGPATTVVLLIGE